MNSKEIFVRVYALVHKMWKPLVQSSIMSAAVFISKKPKHSNVGYLYVLYTEWAILDSAQNLRQGFPTTGLIPN